MGKEIKHTELQHMLIYVETYIEIREIFPIVNIYSCNSTVLYTSREKDFFDMLLRILCAYEMHITREAIQSQRVERR